MDENIGRTFLLWNVYHCYSTTKGAIDKWMEQPDSAHQIGLGPTLHRVLILGWWCCPRWKVQSSLGEIFTCGIWDIFTCSSTTKGAIAEWRPKLDSTRQRGTEATLEAFLIVVESGALQELKKCGRNFLSSDFGNVLVTLATTSRAMDNDYVYNCNCILIWNESLSALSDEQSRFDPLLNVPEHILECASCPESTFLLRLKHNLKCAFLMCTSTNIMCFS